MKPIILFFKKPKKVSARPVRKMVLFFKAEVKGHKRRLASGKIVTVRPYWNKRGKKSKGNMGQDAPKATAKTGANVSNAYEVAKGGGRHHGVYVRYRNQRAQEIEKSIRSFIKRINEHKDKIARPMQYVQPDITEQHLAHLVSTLWPEEIMDFEMKIEIMKGILQERNNG